MPKQEPVAFPLTREGSAYGHHQPRAHPCSSDAALYNGWTRTATVIFRAHPCSSDAAIFCAYPCSSDAALGNGRTIRLIAAAAATSAAEAATPATEAAAPTTARATLETFTVAAKTASGASTAIATAEEVQTVAHMEHGIRRDGVHLLVAPAVGIDGAAEVGLFVQDVIPLQHDGELLAAQEALTQLCVPYQLVGVQCLVAVSALTETVEVGAQVHSPRECDAGVAAIAEVPRGEVARGLQAVLCVSVGQPSVQRDVEPLVAEAERHVGREVIGVCNVSVGYGSAVQVYIGYLVVIAAVHSAAQVPAVEGVETNVERAAHIAAPVAVDVLRTLDAPAGRLIVGYYVAYAVAGAAHAAVKAEAPMALGLGHHEPQAILHQLGCALFLEVGVEVGGERWLQPWITHGDGERIGVIVDVEQLCDAGLLCLSAQRHLEVGLLVEAVAHVQRRRHVGDGAHGVNGPSQILLYVVRALWLQLYAYIHIELFAYQPQLHVNVVSTLGAL